MIQNFEMVEFDIMPKKKLFELFETLTNEKVHCNVNVNIHNGPFNQVMDEYKVFINETDWKKLMATLRFLRYANVKMWFKKAIIGDEFFGVVSTTPPYKLR